jgi:hypothetical protein
VRWPETALIAAREAGADYYGWLPNYRVPEVARSPSGDAACTARTLCPAVAGHPDHPAIRGIGLRHTADLLALGRQRRASSVSGEDYLSARDGGGDGRHLLRDLLHDPGLAQSLARSGRERILAASYLCPSGRRAAGDRRGDICAAGTTRRRRIALAQEQPA